VTAHRDALKALAAVALAGLFASAAGAQAADPAKGKALFARCAICHAVEPGRNKLGPSLAGMFGRKAGTVPGFTYSPAMKSSKIVWDDKTVDAFIAKPTAVVPGTRMAFPGLSGPADRANLIAYLRTATKAK